MIFPVDSAFLFIVELFHIVAKILLYHMQTLDMLYAMRYIIME